MSYISKVIATKDGRKFINEVLSFCGVYQSSDGTANDLLRKEGKRQVGLHILSLIQENDRTHLYSMMEEAYLANKEKEDEQRESSKRSREDHDSGTNFNYQYYTGDRSDDEGHDSGEGLNL